MVTLIIDWGDWDEIRAEAEKQGLAVHSDYFRGTGPAMTTYSIAVEGDLPEVVQFLQIAAAVLAQYNPRRQNELILELARDIEFTGRVNFLNGWAVGEEEA